jgi:hypothetical protein
MARRTDVAEVEQNETEEVPNTDSTPDQTSDGAGNKPATKKAEPKRGQLPEGYVTPVGLATLLSQPKDGNAENTDASNFRHTDRNGGHDVKPQMVYSYIKNASKDAPFPLETVTDSIGASRQAVQIDAGLAWWDAKNERVAGRRQNAAAKAAAKAERAAAKPATEAEGETSDAGDATEAE